MRNLIILRGIPASGKSTWIKNNELEQFTVSSDALRLLYAGVEYDLEGHQRISQKADKKVWNELYSIVENRMKDGQLTVVDATHISEKSISEYKKLSKKYNYRITIVQFNISLEEALKRNAEREEYKQVPEKVIRDMYERSKQKWNGNYEIIDTEDSTNIKNRLFTSGEDLTKYEKIVVFGDIHASFSPLKEYFDNNPYSKDNFYIFLGDYVDRNYQCNEVVSFLYDLMQNDNVILLHGNHESHVKKILRGESVENTTDEFMKTWSLLSEENREKLKAIGRKVRQMFVFKQETVPFPPKIYICTHGGISKPVFNIEIPTKQLIKGVGNYSDMQVCDENFTKLSLEEQHAEIYSIHGHRNIENVDIQNTKRTFNLCDDVEHGGYLRILEITKDGFNPIKIRNNDYIKKSDKLYTDEIVKKLHESGYVKEKELNDGIVSFNFTREAFFKNHWDDISVLARGLFVDSETGRILARSYSKFFNAWFEENDSNTEHEYGDCSIYALKNKIAFPAMAYKKENGYLGIVSWDYKNNDFFIASKSTNLGEYALHFKEMFMDRLEIISESTGNDDIIQALKDFVKKGYSMIFEVVDEEFDPHIIRNHDDKITKKFVLLDIVKNDFSESYMNYKDLVEFGKAHCLSVKDKRCVVNNFLELLSFLEDHKDYVISRNRNPSKEIEGFVIEDSNGFRFKFKTAFYCFWKNLRNKIENYKKGNNVNFTKDEQSVITTLPKKLNEYDNILEVREDYYKNWSA